MQIVEGDYDWQNFAVSAEEDPAKRDPNSTLYCGYKTPPAIIFSTKPVLNVVFKSGQHRAKLGFMANYQFLGHPGVYSAHAHSQS